MYGTKLKIKDWVRPAYFSIRRLIFWLPLANARVLKSLSLAHIEKAQLFPPRGVYSSTLEWISSTEKYAFEAKYIEIDPPQKITRQLKPKTVEPKIHPQFLQEERSTFAASFVAVIPRGRVWQDCGAVITPDNQLLKDVSAYRRPTYPQGIHPIFCDWQWLPLRREQGQVAVLSTDSTHVYYHWIFDFVLRYAVLEKAGFSIDKVDKVVISNCDKSYQKQTLEVLGISESKLIIGKDYPHIQAEQLIVPSYPTWGGHYRKWHLDFLRSAFAITNLSLNATDYKRVYISRGQAAYRRVLNEDEVIAVLSEFGFQVLRLEEYSFKDQVAIMSSVEAVVAPHGSGLTNIAFCKTGTKIIEIFSPDLVALFYWKISDVLSLEYYYLIGESENSEASKQSWNSRADIQVSISKLRQTLQEAALC